VLNEIAFWLFFVPVAFIDALAGMVGVAHAQGVELDATALQSMSSAEIVASIPLFIVLIYFLFWGQACVLVVAKRMVSSPAGRNRTSFKAVRKEAKKYITTLFLTELLRSIITVLLTLLLIVPGIIYSVRTLFYDIIMIEDGKIAYGRESLNRSKDIVTGNTWNVLWRVATMAICIFIPTGLLNASVMGGLTAADSRLETFAIILNDFVGAFTGVFFIVCTVALYAELKKTNAGKYARASV